jgi:hypothetical protein
VLDKERDKDGHKMISYNELTLQEVSSTTLSDLKGMTHSRHVFSRQWRASQAGGWPKGRSEDAVQAATEGKRAMESARNLAAACGLFMPESSRAFKQSDT